MTYVPRSQWTSYKPVLTPLPRRPATHVFIHHSVTAQGTDLAAALAIVAGIEDYHIHANGWRAIAYNLLATVHGDKVIGRGWGVEGGATGSWADDQGISMCAVGNFEDTKPTRKLKRALAEMIADGVESGELVPFKHLQVVGHRDKPYATACPGKYLWAEVPNIRKMAGKILRNRARRRRIMAAIRALRVDLGNAETRTERQSIRARIRRLRDRLAG